MKREELIIDKQHELIDAYRVSDWPLIDILEPELAQLLSLSPAADKPKDWKCHCGESSTGWTQIKACNICGMEVEWNPQPSAKEEVECEHDWMYKILHDHTACDVCTKCGKTVKQDAKPQPPMSGQEEICTCKYADATDIQWINEEGRYFHVLCGKPVSRKVQPSATSSPMTTERIKEIQKATGYPESVSVQQALLQVWNECEQGRKAPQPSATAEDALNELFNDLELNAYNHDFHSYYFKDANQIIRKHFEKYAAKPVAERELPGDEAIEVWANYNYGCSGTLAPGCIRDVNIAIKSAKWMRELIKERSK